MPADCAFDTPSQLTSVGTRYSIADDKERKRTMAELISTVRIGKRDERILALDELRDLYDDDCEGFGDELIERHGLPVLIDCLEAKMDSPSQFASLMVLANFTSGSKQHNLAVVDMGAVLPFIEHIDSPCLTIAEQAIICVGNIACEDALTRKVLYENGGFHAVLRFLGREALELEQLNSGVWALNVVASCVITLKRLLMHTDPEILRSACAASAYLTDGPPDRLQMFLDARLCQPILKLIKHSDPLVVFSALRATSNFLSGTDQQIEQIVEMGVVASLARTLKRHKERRIVKEACMALSNVTAGSQSDILKIIQSGIVDDLIHVARHAPMDIRSEAIWTVGNAVIGSGHSIIKEFLTPECMKVLISALTFKNPDIVKLTLQAIQNFLWGGDFAENPSFDISLWDSENDEEFWEHADWFTSAHGLFRLASLRRHPDCEISQMALHLLSALVEDPYALCLEEEEGGITSGTDDEESEYEDLLGTTASSPTNSPTIP